MKMRKVIALSLLVLFALTILVGCGNTNEGPTDTNATEKNETKQTDSEKIKIGVSMESLESQFLVANYNAMKEEAKKQGVELVEAIADGDINKQLQQIENFIAMDVDAIICTPKDQKAIVAAIKKANEAGIPFITNNRSAAEGAEVALDVGSDSYAMAKKEAQWLVDYAKDKNIKFNALVLVGDLKDNNAALRDKGFTEIADANKDILNIVQKVPTEWKPELALSGTINALEANKDINLIFTPSDALLPAVTSALKQSNCWFKYDEPDHVFIATFDGAKEGLDLIKEGYADIQLVQDAIFTGSTCIQGAVKLAKGEKLESDKVYEPGFEVTRENFDETSPRAWGYTK